MYLYGNVHQHMNSAQSPSNHDQMNGNAILKEKNVNYKNNIKLNFQWDMENIYVWESNGKYPSEDQSNGRKKSLKGPVFILIYFRGGQVLV